jgi:uncharacterized coiled-coil protein SlyX
MDHLKQDLKPLNESKLLLQVQTLTEKLMTLEQQRSDDDLGIKVAALESEVNSLMDVLPNSQGNSEVAVRLSEQEQMLRALTDHQNWQIHEQQTQIEQLQAELDQLSDKMNSSLSYPAVQKSSEEMLPVVETELQQQVASLLEKNAFMETVIERQKQTLDLQEDRVQAVEEKFEQWLSSQKRGERVADTTSAFQKEFFSSGRIRVVERKIRRNMASVVNQKPKRCPLQFGFIRGFYRDCSL